MNRMSTKQTIISVLVIAISVYLAMQLVHGQTVNGILAPCVIYESPVLIIINLNCDDVVKNPQIASYVAKGFEIKAVTETTMYLTKVK